MEPHAFAYLDDIIVIGAREVRAPSRSKAALKSVRVQVLPKETSVLGYLISEEGIRTHPDKKLQTRDSIPRLTSRNFAATLVSHLGTGLTSATHITTSEEGR